MSCPEFIARTFAVRTAAHLHHLASSSYAEHVALADFYDPLGDLIDAYAEIYQGLEGQIRTYPNVSPPKTAPVGLLEDYLDMVRAEQAEDQDSEALMNVLAEIEALTARSLYKLKFLK
jgi:hypothetical protein